MDESCKRLLQRIMRRIPSHMLRNTLEKWEHLTAEQRQSIDYSQAKWALTERLLEICEENELTMKHISELEMTYIMDSPNQGMWYALQLTNPQDYASSVELMEFREQFKSNLKELVRPVNVKIKKHSDEAVWIRVAWGDAFTRPNHLKPTYVVYYLQTPYVFVTGLASKKKPLLSQALVLATRYEAIKDANLNGRNLNALRDLLMRQYEHVFPVKNAFLLDENVKPASNPNIEKEQAELATNRLQMACEAFGGGTLPQLQSAVYRLETKYRDHSNQTMMEREESFKCMVKFTSSNLLESLRHCAASGIASSPVTPLLSCIPQKGRNYFVITDNGPAASQTRQQTQQ